MLHYHNSGSDACSWFGFRCIQLALLRQHEAGDSSLRFKHTIHVYDTSLRIILSNLTIHAYDSRPVVQLA